MKVRRADNEKPAVSMAMPNMPTAVWLTRSVLLSTYVAGSMRKLKYRVSLPHVHMCLLVRDIPSQYHYGRRKGRQPPVPGDRISVGIHAIKTAIAALRSRPHWRFEPFQHIHRECSSLGSLGRIHATLSSLRHRRLLLRCTSPMRRWLIASLVYGGGRAHKHFYRSNTWPEMCRYTDCDAPALYSLWPPVVVAVQPGCGRVSSYVLSQAGPWSGSLLQVTQERLRVFSSC